MPIIVPSFYIFYKSLYSTTTNYFPLVLRNNYALSIDHVGLVRARLEELSVLRSPYI